MPNRSADALFQLIKSLGKSEKRNFKLFAQRNTGANGLKIVQLFDALDRFSEYDEGAFLRKSRTFSRAQLPNLKAHLYKQILASLRVLRDDSTIEIQLHEAMENARILYNKGLFQQSLQLLERIKNEAKAHHQGTFWLQALTFEKKIEALHITCSLRDRAENLSTEVEMLNERLTQTGAWSNLSLRLYGLYIQNGHARNADDAASVRAFFEAHLPADDSRGEGFFGRLYCYQSYCWFAFIQQDFLLYYRYAKKWADLFGGEPAMKKVEPIFFLKGLHNLLLAHFMLKNYPKFAETLSVLEDFAQSEAATANENARAQTFIYLNIARIHGHFLHGTFTEGLRLVPEIEEKLAAFSLQIDPHRELVFYYKIASLYFGSGDAGRAIDYLQRIIHWKTDLRGDLQCYARLLHLISHYELGNFTILESLIKSTYRFMAKMERLSRVETEIFKFLSKAFQLDSPAKIRAAFVVLKVKLEKLALDPFENRSFLYLDFISWLESKIAGEAVQAIIRQKFEGSVR